jgi:hypothetical protein
MLSPTIVLIFFAFRFANLSSLDDGFYGKGIYFTTHAPYSISYVSNRRDPAMIISWILPGNCFPGRSYSPSNRNKCSSNRRFHHFDPSPLHQPPLSRRLQARKQGLLLPAHFRPTQKLVFQSCPRFCSRFRSIILH